MVILDNKVDIQLKLERNSLRVQAKELLRNYIISGQIPPGTKLVERTVAELLGISRAPARDALIELEKEGLIVTKSNGRHVIDPTERDIRELHQVRIVLEKLAVELATQNTSAQNAALLNKTLEKMKHAIAHHDQLAFTESDVEAHWLIWQQAHNKHLLSVLKTMIGPIFMFVARHANHFDWNETLKLHEELVDCINMGDTVHAKQSIERHLDNSLQRALKAFRGG
jgi:DNA-binding GntR family transcriptional regulator